MRPPQMMSASEAESYVDSMIVAEWGKPIPSPTKGAFAKMIEDHGLQVFSVAVVNYKAQNGGSSAPQPTPVRLRDFLPKDMNEPKAQPKVLHWFDSTGSVSDGFYNQQPEPNEETADWLLRLNIDRLRGGTSVNVKDVERLIGFFAPNSYWWDNYGQSEKSREDVWHEAIDESRRLAKEREADDERKKAEANKSDESREEARQQFLDSAKKLTDKVKEVAS